MNPHLSYADILAYIDTFDVVAYAKTRNHLDGAVSKLSLYITRGVIDAATIRDRVLQRYSYQQAEKFIQELAWREYFQKVWQAKGDAIFSDLRFTRPNWAHSEVVQAIVEANTGITLIDEQLQLLFKTGYMHNHARMWTAMLACNVGQAHWHEMGRFLYYHLIDGDLASNMLSWQWVSGTSIHTQYVANQALLNACSHSTQTGTYLDRPREEIGIGNIPTPLLAHEPFTNTTIYPISEVTNNTHGQTFFLYHPWSLDPHWRQHETGTRILIIEPHLFDRFPVSPQVMDSIVTTARLQIPTITIYVGNIETLPGITDAAAIYSKRYPGAVNWPGTIDDKTELFPTVTGYFPSFFAFWQACEKTRTQS